MADPMTGGGVTHPNQHDELRHQQLELKNVLPLDIYLGMEYASMIQSAMPYGTSIKPRHIQGFYRTFWHIYHYVKNSVDAEKLNPDLIEVIDKWFAIMPGQHRNTKLVLLGVELYLDFVRNMQEWGIGRLFEKGIDPPFMLEDVDDFDMLIEDLDEEVIAGAN